MSLPSVNGPIGLPAAQTDYGRALALRSMAAAYAELPRYLLAPEVTGLQHHLSDWRQHALVNTLGNTGGRLNKVLALRRRAVKHLYFTAHIPAQLCNAHALSPPSAKGAAVPARPPEV